MPEEVKSVKMIKAPVSRGMPGVFAFRAGKRTTFYLFREISCDIGGRGWEVYRLTSQVAYHVRTGYKGANLRCDCTGFNALGMCRHVLSIQNFVHLGQVGDVEEVIENPPEIDFAPVIQAVAKSKETKEEFFV